MFHRFNNRSHRFTKFGQGWTAFADPYGQEVLRRWNIRTDYYAVMQLLLGYPREGDEHPTSKLRKDGRILRV